jgi:hypothetical protein
VLFGDGADAGDALEITERVHRLLIFLSRIRGIRNCGTNHHEPKWRHLAHIQLSVLQQLLPLPLGFKISLFASSKKRAPPDARAS